MARNKCITEECSNLAALGGSRFCDDCLKTFTDMEPEKLNEEITQAKIQEEIEAGMAEFAVALIVPGNSISIVIERKDGGSMAEGDLQGQEVEVSISGWMATKADVNTKQIPLEAVRMWSNILQQALNIEALKQGKAAQRPWLPDGGRHRT